MHVHVFSRTTSYLSDAEEIKTLKGCHKKIVPMVRPATYITTLEVMLVYKLHSRIKP